jgi:Dolichyl-phosphate-mannose-protein mannosyltransferase
MSSDAAGTERHVSWRVRGLLLGLALASSLASDALVFLGRSGPAAIACWAVSLLLLAGAFQDEVLNASRLLRPTWKRAGLLLLFLLPVVVRVLNTDTCRLHGDGLLTAFFSATEDISPKRFFAEIPENAGQWVCQFPTAFFLLQRLFFHVFGDTLAMVPWSVIPYVFLAGAFLYLSARRVADAFTGVVSVVLYSFLAISLYLETVGLMFVSSTAVFLVFFFFALRALQDDRHGDALLAGVTCGFCYLFYTSSYIALPVLFAVIVLRTLRRRRLEAWRMLALPALGFAVAIGPFITHALKIHNYFLGRIEQVSLLNGQWSNAAERMAKGEGALEIVGQNLAVALRAFYTSGIGGHGGYWFAHLSLLDRGTLVLFLTGLAVAVFRMRRRAEIGLVLLVVAASFVTGVVLTIPPPAYHRLAAAFPFFAVVMALPFREVWAFERLSRTARAALVAGGLALFAAGNLNTFSIAALPEYSTVELLFASWINRRYPDRQLYIAAFPANAYEKIAYFATPRRKGKTIADYHDPLLQELNTDEKYVYIVLFADEFKARFQKVDPKGHFKVFAPGWGIFVN